MKISLSTLLLFVTIIGLLIYTFALNQKYQQLAEKYFQRTEIVEKEYLRVTGDTISPARLQESLERTDEEAVHIAGRIAKKDNHRKKVGALAKPEVVLQIRSGAGGGNPNRIDMMGQTSIYVSSVVKNEIPFNPEVDINEQSHAYFSGGFIPDDKIFVIQEIEYQAAAAGDSNGDGEFLIGLGKQEIVRIGNNPNVLNNTWYGEFAVHPGHEAEVFVEVANSSAGHAKFSGKFLPRPGWSNR